MPWFFISRHNYSIHVANIFAVSLREPNFLSCCSIFKVHLKRYQIYFFRNYVHQKENQCFFTKRISIISVSKFLINLEILESVCQNYSLMFFATYGRLSAKPCFSTRSKCFVLHTIKCFGQHKIQF